MPNLFNKYKVPDTSGQARGYRNNIQSVPTDCQNKFFSHSDGYARIFVVQLYTNIDAVNIE